MAEPVSRDQITRRKRGENKDCPEHKHKQSCTVIQHSFYNNSSSSTGSGVRVLFIPRSRLILLIIQYISLNGMNRYCTGKYEYYSLVSLVEVLSTW